MIISRTSLIEGQNQPQGNLERLERERQYPRVV